MTRTDYHIGDLIHLVDERNKNLKYKDVLGVNLSKVFIPTVANLTGVDLSVYKVIRHNQFGAKFMSVARDGILPVALNKKKSPALISSAYYVFEVSDQDLIRPDYLMLLLKNPSFDNALWFYSGGDVRGGINWEDFCNISVSIPSCEEQDAILKEVNSYQNLTDNLYRTLRAIDKRIESLFHVFFDQHLGVQSKSSSNSVKLDTIAKLKAGGDKPIPFSEIKTEDCNIPVYSNSLENDGLFGYTNRPVVSQESITITARGINVGHCFVREPDFVPIVRLITISPNKRHYTFFLWQYYKSLKLEGDGSAQGQLTIPQLLKYNVPLPPDDLLVKFEELVRPLYLYSLNCKKQIDIIKSILNLSLRLIYK